MIRCSRFNCLVLAALLVLQPISVLFAAPLVTVSVVARKSGTSDAYTSTLAVQNGEAIDLQFIARLAPTGTNNASAGNASSYTQGTDGINSMKFNAYQSTTNQIQVNLTPVTLTGGFNNGTGNSGGTQKIRSGSNNDLENIRPIQNAGTYVGLNANAPINVIFASASATVTSTGTGTSSTLNLSYLLPDPISSTITVGGKFNGGSIFTGNVDDTDPVLAFDALTLTALPEPATFSLLAIPVLLMLRRHRRND